MSTPAPDEAPKPDPPAELPPPAEPASAPVPPPEEPKPKSRWKRYKLPINRKDRPVHVAPTEPRPKSNTLRTLLIVFGVLVGLPIAGCLFLWVLCAVGIR